MEEQEITEKKIERHAIENDKRIYLFVPNIQVTSGTKQK